MKVNINIIGTNKCDSTSSFIYSTEKNTYNNKLI